MLESIIKYLLNSYPSLKIIDRNPGQLSTSPVHSGIARFSRKIKNFEPKNLSGWKLSILFLLEVPKLMETFPM